MEAIVNFLLEYYVWVLVVLVILLITVIGFLADSMKKRKMRNKVESESQTTNTNISNQQANEFTNMENINSNMFNPNMMGSTNMNPNVNMDANNFNMSGNLNNNMMSEVSQNYMNNELHSNSYSTPATSSVNVAPVNMNSNFNNPVNMGNFSNPSLSNMNNNLGFNEINRTATSTNMEAPQSNEQSFFTPVSEQTPKFEPREVVIPKPVEVTPIINNEPVNGWSSYGQSTINNNTYTTPSAVSTPGIPVEVSPVREAMTNSRQMSSTSTINNIASELQAIGAMPNSNYTTPVAPTNNAHINQTPVSPIPSNLTNPTVVPSNNQVNQNFGPVPNSNEFADSTASVTSNESISNNLNSNFINGGSTFIVGTPKQTINTTDNQNNGNWQL